LFAKLSLYSGRPLFIIVTIIIIVNIYLLNCSLHPPVVFIKNPLLLLVIRIGLFKESALRMNITRSDIRMDN